MIGGALVTRPGDSPSIDASGPPATAEFDDEGVDVAMRSILRATALIDTWFDMLPPAHAGMARALHALITDTAATLVPTVKWGNIVYVQDGSHLLALMVHKTHLNLQVFNGAALAERFPELEGSGKGMRHLKCRHGLPIDEELVREIVSASIELARLDRRSE